MNTEFENPTVNKSISKMYMSNDLADVYFTFPNENVPSIVPSAKDMMMASVSSAMDMSSQPIESVKVPAHKLILASSSAVFRALFYGPRVTSASFVRITGTTSSAFKEFLQIFYLSKVGLTAGNMEEVLRLATKYNMLAYFDMCFASIQNQLNAENMAWGYQFAMSLNNSSLKEFCEHRIRVLTKDVLKSHTFTQCSSEVIQNILRLDRLDCNEVDLFNGCIAWAKSLCRKQGHDESNSKNLKDLLGPCFYLLRFDLMEPEAFGNIMLNKTNAGLFTTEELTDIIRTKWTKDFRSEYFNHVSRVPQSKVAPNRLVCMRIYESGQPCYFQEKESTWFSTDESVWLKTIYFDTIYNDHFGKEIIDATMKIIEYTAKALPIKNLPYKVHGNGTYKIDNVANRIVTFTSPILINPHKVYEIRLNIKSKIHGCFHLSKYATEVKSENVTITFHQDPLDQDSSRRGLISQLIFSRN